jgi:hypothetical protein
MIEIDEEYSYEYEESSLTLMNDVQLFTDNDSMLKKNEQINEATQSFLLISYEEISQQLNTFLTELEQASNDKIKSQYLFSLEDEKTMFRYHDDVDVRDSVELLK